MQCACQNICLYEFLSHGEGCSERTQVVLISFLLPADNPHPQIVSLASGLPLQFNSTLSWSVVDAALMPDVSTFIRVTGSGGAVYADSSPFVIQGWSRVPTSSGGVVLLSLSQLHMLAGITLMVNRTLSDSPVFHLYEDFFSISSLPATALSNLEVLLVNVDMGYQQLLQSPTVSGTPLLRQCTKISPLPGADPR